MQAGTRVRIPWKTHHDIPTWNQKCEWAVKTFGLPGDKFDTHATEDYMEWMFNSIEDQLFFILAWGNDQ